MLKRAKKQIALAMSFLIFLANVLPTMTVSAASITSGQTVSVTQKQRISGADNGYFIVANASSYGYCAQNKHEQWSNNVAKQGVATEWNNSNVRKALYYGPGGPGYSSSLYGSLGEDMNYVNYTVGYLNGETNNNTKARAYLSYLSGLSDPISLGYKAFLVDIKPDTYQDVAFLAYAPTKGNLTLVKSSANSDLTNGNSCYSLENAVYGVYSNEACTTRVGTLTTNVYGSSNTLSLDAGTYYVKELTAPKGYLLDGKVHKAVVSAEKTTTLSVSDIPENDPISIRLTKINPGNAYVTEVPSLAGAQFTVSYYDGYYTENNLPSTATRSWVIETKETKVGNDTYYLTRLNDYYKVSGDDFYYTSGNNEPVLPLGTIAIEETKPAPGYTLTGGFLKPSNSDTTYSGKYVTQITSSTSGDIALVGGNEFSIANYVLYGGIAVQKYDSETNSAQGAASLAGAEFTIKSLNEGTITVDGKTYDKNELITTLVTDASGYAATANNLLPYGDYMVEEVKAPTGYTLIGTNLKQIVTVSEENTLAVASGTYDNVIRGGLKIQKMDNDTETAVAQGSASLAGAEIEIRNDNEAPVYVNGKSYSKGETVLTLTTNENGFAETGINVLPYGDYVVEEVKAPIGYQLSGRNVSQKVTIANQFDVLKLKTIYDDVVRGGIAVQKFDSQTASSHAQGSATLKGAEVTIRSLNTNDIIVDGKTYSYGEDILILTTDKNGYASTKSALLPYGEYEVEETKAPKGYNLFGKNLKQKVTVNQQNTMVELNTDDTVISDDVIRGDFKFTKMEYYSKRLMGEVEFKITSQTTGESYVIKTDENGYYSSESSFLSHSEDNGLWFGLDKDGNAVPADNKVGALPYDTYTIEELRCSANRMTDLYRGEFEIKENSTVVDLGTIFNYERKISTEAKDSETQNNFSCPDEEVTIIDAVSYQGLFVGEEYTVKGILMNKDTNEALLDKEGNEITGSTTFIPEEREGVVDVEFTFDASSLAGSVGVVFETLYDVDGNVSAEHKDIEDAAQTIYFPEIDTSLVDKEGYDAFLAGPTTLIDTVTYVGLEKGREYKISGTLMDKETGKAVLDKDGNEINSSTTFVANERNGSVDVIFEFDATHLAGKTLVAFEKLFLDDIEYAVHEDIEDEAQTVYIPKIDTSATDKKDGDKQLSSTRKVTVVDTVTYKNLTVGETYVVKGVLMDKSTKKPLLVNGKEVTVSKEFTTEKSNGEIELEFTFDASELGTKSIVAFEELYQFVSKDTGTDSSKEERLIAVHKDIDDMDQTVHFTTNPETGDSRPVIVWVALFISSIGALCGLYYIKKKRVK